MIKSWKLWQLWRQEKGSMTLEAAMVFPIVFLCTVMMLFLAVLIFQSVLTAHAAVLASERGAAFWDNSHRDGKSGVYNMGQHDDLYWRLLDDKLLDRVFSGLWSNQAYKVTVPAGNSRGGLPEQKLARAAAYVPNAISGELSYGNSGLERTVTAKFSKPVKSVALARFTGQSIPVEGEAVSAVVDPVEFIRTVELVRYVHMKMQAWAGSGFTVGQAVQLLRGSAAR
ncbi:TadE family protein [Paenibacillus sp. 481]|uniref:TadE family protein n=1 Tax=Paenibacillus sp. 481 TaxID=2835869 RepID=UPI001E29C3D5|nr:TadE family protein [Paenibacillus sp. 481]UHA72067.1 pilus assembly protein [Paenibacillus sp. 481]